MNVLRSLMSLLTRPIGRSRTTYGGMLLITIALTLLDLWTHHELLPALRFGISVLLFGIVFSFIDGVVRPTRSPGQASDH